MVTEHQVIKGVTAFAENELAKKATGFTKFSLYFVLPSLEHQTHAMLHKAMHNPMTAMYFDEAENVDIEKIYNAAKEAIRKSGQFEWMGIIFNETDVDRLYTYIKSM